MAKKTPKFKKAELEQILPFIEALLSEGGFLDDMAAATGLDRQACEDAVVTCICRTAYGDDPRLDSLAKAWLVRG